MPNEIHFSVHCFRFCRRCRSKRSVRSSSWTKSAILTNCLFAQPTIGHLGKKMNQWGYILFKITRFPCKSNGQQSVFTVAGDFVAPIEEHCCSRRCDCSACFELDAPIVFSWLDQCPEWARCHRRCPLNRCLVCFVTHQHFQHQSCVVSFSQSPCIAWMFVTWILAVVHFVARPTPERYINKKMKDETSMMGSVPTIWAAFLCACVT